MKIFFSFLFAIALIATFCFLITSLIFRFKKKQNSNKFFKFTGIAFVISIISLVGVNMMMTPQEKEKIKAEQQAKEKKKEEEQKLEEEKKKKEKEEKAEKKKLEEQKKQEEKQKKEEQEKLEKQKKQEEKQKEEEQKKLEEQKKQEEKQKKEEQEKLEKQKKQEEDQKKLEEQKKLEDQKKQENFVSYAKNIRGGAFIKDIKLNNNEAEITYCDSYGSYKAQKPDSNVTEDMYKDYFSTGYAIEKILVGEPARLLRQFPDLNAVKMTLPFEGKTYSINLDRNSLNTYIGFKIEDLKVEDKSWVKKFNDPYVYNKSKRKAFFNKFVSVQ